MTRSPELVGLTLPFRRLLPTGINLKTRSWGTCRTFMSPTSESAQREHLRFQMGVRPKRILYLTTDLSLLGQPQVALNATVLRGRDWVKHLPCLGYES
jgi:hypothetical protein